MASMNKRPADTPFKQQRLPAWQPILTPKSVIPTFFAVGMLFIPIGIVILTASDNVKESEHKRYDVECPASTPPVPCSVTLNVDESMSPPIYMYYQLTNYYQNHRRYVQSRSDLQLAGERASYSDILNCEPLRSSGGKGRNDLYYPCGLIANSWFNDTITMFDGEIEVPLRKKGIAWKSDVDVKFKVFNPGNASDQPGLPPPNLPEWQKEDVIDEDFIVWMRTAGLPKFRKLYRIIDTELPKGTYTLRINSSYPVQDFKGSKTIILSTTSWIGGKNDFLGYAYIVTGLFCLILGSAFLYKYMRSVKRQQMGN